MFSTKRIPATDVRVGDTLAFPDGSSLAVETINRDGRFIDYAGTRTTYSSLGNQTHPGGVASSLFDDEMTVLT